MTSAATDRADVRDQLPIGLVSFGTAGESGTTPASGIELPGQQGRYGRAATLLGRAATTGLLIMAAAGLPSDILPNPIFARMTPVRWWDYALIVGAGLLGALWSVTAMDVRRRQAYRWSALIAGLTLLAVGCPSCNKAAVAILGDLGAMSTWGAIQPVLGSTTLVVAAVALGRDRLRREARRHVVET